MTHRLPRVTRVTALLGAAGTIALGLLLCAGSETVQAAPGFVSGLANGASPVTEVRIYRRGRTPIYPYYYNPGRPGGYSFFFGFVPYAKGDIENQALQRGQYPQNIEWPPVRSASAASGLGAKGRGLTPATRSAPSREKIPEQACGPGSRPSRRRSPARWWQVACEKRRGPCSTAPPLGSAAPK